MRNNHANQRVARDVAENRGQFDSGYDARAREIRAENARRTLGAQTMRSHVRETAGMRREREAVEFMRSIMSTPYAEVRS